MALERIWCLKTRSQDKTIAVFADETVYGTPNTDRDDEAHYILIAKMDENQKLTFIEGVDNSEPLTTLEYTFVQSLDGAYRLIQFTPNFWSNVTAYVKETKVDDNVTVYADIVWEATTEQFYIAIANSTAVQPGVTSGWETSWEVLTFELFQTQVSSNKGNIVIHDDLITFRYEDCMLEQLDEVTDDILCGVCAKFDDLFKTLAMQLMLDAANSYNWQDKQTKADTIVLEASKKFCC